MAKKLKNKKNITLADLATTLDDLAITTAKGFGRLETRMDDLDSRLTTLTDAVQNIANKLAHYIDLHEEHYLDLKHRYKLLTKWAEKVAAKTGVPLQL